MNIRLSVKLVENYPTSRWIYPLAFGWLVGLFRRNTLLVMIMRFSDRATKRCFWSWLHALSPKAGGDRKRQQSKQLSGCRSVACCL